MSHKSADFVLDFLISSTRDKVLHWEYCIDVIKKTEPHDTSSIAHMQGICSAFEEMLATLQREKELL